MKKELFKKEKQTIGEPKREKLLHFFFLLLGDGVSLEKAMSELNIIYATFYNYITRLTNYGVTVNHYNSKYYIDANELTKAVYIAKQNLTSEELAELEMVITNSSISDDMKMRLQGKLLTNHQNVIDSEFEAFEKFIDEKDKQKVKTLLKAKNERKRVRLIDYRSSNSQTVQSRDVEPVDVVYNQGALYCYDVKSESMRIYKISRCQSVKVLGNMEFRNRHNTQMKSDIFKIVGEPNKPIELILNLRAYNLLMEEFVVPNGELIKQENQTYKLQTKVVSYDGVGRFVLGLPNDITVVNPDDEFKSFLQNKVKAIKKSFKF